MSDVPPPGEGGKGSDLVKALTRPKSGEMVPVRWSYHPEESRGIAALEAKKAHPGVSIVA